MSNSIYEIGKECLISSLPYVRSIHFALPNENGRLPIQGPEPIVDASDITGSFNPEAVPSSRPLPQYYIHKDLKSAQFRESQIISSDAGDYIQQSLEFFIKKDRLDIKRNIIRLMNNRVHVFLGFFDGSYKFVTFMRQSYVHSNIDQSQDQYKFTLTARKLLPAPWLNGYVPNENGSTDLTTPATGGNGGSNPTYLDVAISRWTYADRSGTTLAIEPNLPGTAEKLHVYRNGVLQAWGSDVNKVGDNLIFPNDDPLDSDLIELIYFNY